MASLDELMRFLMSIMGDKNSHEQFARDPETMLADRGLADVSGQDVRDARLMLADCGAALPSSGGGHGGGHGGGGHGSGSGHGAIDEIHYTATNFEVGDVTVTTTVISVEDNDTVIVDSFNNDVTAIQDNDTTDIDVIHIEDNDSIEDN